jgi:hypothetical protein
VPDGVLQTNNVDLLCFGETSLLQTRPKDSQTKDQPAANHAIATCKPETSAAATVIQKQGRLVRQKSSRHLSGATPVNCPKCSEDCGGSPRSFVFEQSQGSKPPTRAQGQTHHLHSAHHLPSSLAIVLIRKDQKTSKAQKTPGDAVLFSFVV